MSTVYPTLRPLTGTTDVLFQQITQSKTTQTITLLLFDSMDREKTTRMRTIEVSPALTEVEMLDAINRTFASYDPEIREFVKDRPFFWVNYRVDPLGQIGRWNLYNVARGAVSEK